MSEAILISIQPKCVEKILNREKAIEIRKTIPKCKLPIDVYIYCTQAKPYCAKAFKIIEDIGKVTPNEYGLFKTKPLLFEPINGKVVAKFTLRNIEQLDEFSLFEGMDEINKSRIEEYSCVDIDDLLVYKGNKKYIYAWYIEDLEIFDNPKELIDFKTPLFHCFNIKNVECVETVFGEYVLKCYENRFCKICKHIDDFGGCGKKGREILTKAPQSWQFVEVD